MKLRRICMPVLVMLLWRTKFPKLRKNSLIKFLTESVITKAFVTCLIKDYSSSCDRLCQLFCYDIILYSSMKSGERCHLIPLFHMHYFNASYCIMTKVLCNRVNCILKFSNTSCVTNFLQNEFQQFSTCTMTVKPLNRDFYFSMQGISGVFLWNRTMFDKHIQIHFQLHAFYS